MERSRIGNKVSPRAHRRREPHAATLKSRPGFPLESNDWELMDQGKHLWLYRKLGAQLLEHLARPGVQFTVWAPHAERVSVVGEFNDWNPAADPMECQGGIWSTFVPGVQDGQLYKYSVYNAGKRTDKADPFAFAAELRPRNASRVCRLNRHRWHDSEWIEQRNSIQSLDMPMAIYELHMASWRHSSSGQFPGYREVAEQLIPYLKEMGYTHVELMPICEYPLDESWGYQTTGYFAPTSRYGTPADFMQFVDACHCNGIGVILDWVPAHFPKDRFALARFDGTCLFEHEDPRKGHHPHWKTSIFNYDRNEVHSFLLSSAMFWCDRYHIDGLRVDAVASMLYLDYGRSEGEWEPNHLGGNQNLAAVRFLQDMNRAVHDHFPGVLTIAEESTAWDGVTRPVDEGGLGFSLKWNMGWMNDTLRYFSRDPIHRRFHHDDLTFSMMYAWSENFLLPFSHDEVVHGKRSLLAKMPGDDWQQFANLRLLLAYMYAHPGKKLLFMGGELASWDEWSENQQLPWQLCHDTRHGGVQRLVRDLNQLYRSIPALHQQDCVPEGFEWIDCHDAEHSVLAFIRRGREPNDWLIAVANMTPMPREGYRVGTPQSGRYGELLNTDSQIYGGANLVQSELTAQPVPAHGRPWSIELTLPPLGLLLLRPVAE